jgi:TATA-binding protein-associated factor
MLRALTLLRQTCGHPDLVAPEWMAGGGGGGGGGIAPPPPRFALEDSCKLLALRDIMLQLGFVEEGGVGGGGDASPAAPAILPTSADARHAHRALVFSQMRGMLDAVAVGLLRARFPRVRFLRLDGATPRAARARAVADFNADAGIGLLLLTTGAGALGLNLTGADTVVFLDHAWNPARDAQAQDRAHRLGQRRAVTVYRLLARGTVEEAIMSQQAWKARMAASVVGADNASLAAGVGTAPLLRVLLRAGGARADGDGAGGDADGDAHADDGDPDAEADAAEALALDDFNAFVRGEKHGAP